MIVFFFRASPNGICDNHDFMCFNSYIFIIRIVAEHSDVPWINILKDALLKRDDQDVNISIVDWKNSAKAPYEQATSNTRMVGAQMAELIKFLVKCIVARPESLFLVEFDIGAHVSGFAGKIVKHSKIELGRIKKHVLPVSAFGVKELFT